jgi:hypothetical protein
VGSGIGELGGLGIENADLSRVVAGATRGFGNALTAGQSPSEALMAGGLGGLGGLATGILGNNPLNLASSSGAAPGTANAIPTPDALAADASGSADSTGGAYADTAPPVTTDAGDAVPVSAPVESPLTQIANPNMMATYGEGVGPATTATTPAYNIGDYGGGLGPTTLTGVPGLSGLAENPNNMATYGESVGQATPAAYRDADGYPLSDTLPPNPPGERSTLGRLGPLLAGGAALAALSGMGSSKSAPPAVQNAIRNLSPAQQEYFNRPSIVWDWDKLAADAASSNVSLDQFMAQNWNRVSGGEYNKAPAMAQGGLNAMSRFVRGGGTGRSDEIDAKLSDGEYVIDAETVAMLGDGSSKAGAKRLDEMRAEIRKHKGKTLARGKFSPDAKSPLTYLKGVA